MPGDVNRQWILRDRPKNQLAESDFELRRAPVPEPGPGEALTRTLYISVDAANRAWMSPVRTYIDPVEPGGVMRSMTLGQVVRSNDAALAPGDIVEGMAGWQDFAVAPAKQLNRVEKRKPLSHDPERTWGHEPHGLLRAPGGRAAESPERPCWCRPRPAPSGRWPRSSRRSTAVEWSAWPARMTSAAGSRESSASTRPSTTRPADLGRAIRDACPKGIDVYFDNVGGPILEAALFQMRERRPHRVLRRGIPIRHGSPEPGPRGVPGLLVVKRLRMEGFIVMDFYARRREAEDTLAAPHRRGAPRDPRGHRRGARARASGAHRLAPR